MPALEDRPVSAASPSPDAKALLVAAGAVVARDGLEGLTVRAIAREADTTTMAIYSRLGGKDGVLEAINGEGFAALREAVSRALAAVPDSDVDRVTAICRTLRAFAVACPNHYRVMFGTPPDRYSRSPAAEKRTKEFFVLLRGTMARLAGEETATTDAYALLALCHGLIELQRSSLASAPATAESTFNAAIAAAIAATQKRSGRAGAEWTGTDRNRDATLPAVELATGPVEYADPSLRSLPARNAPCPCGSGKRYKHCHGVG